MKALVLGKGKLGSEIVKQTGWDYLSRAEHEITIDNFDEWKDRMSVYDVIVNCIGNTDTYSDDKEKHWKANYELVTFLAEFCDENNKKLVHISTDYLYQMRKQIRLVHYRFGAASAISLPELEINLAWLLYRHRQLIRTHHHNKHLESLAKSITSHVLIDPSLNHRLQLNLAR